MSAPKRQTIAQRIVSESRKPLPKWVGIAGVALSAIAALGHTQLVLVFGERGAALIPVLAAIMAAVSHSVGGTGGKDAEPT